jgi:hypothetical protein
MAYWGVAISRRPNPLVPPFSQEALQAGWDAIEKACSARAPDPKASPAGGCYREANSDIAR